MNRTTRTLATAAAMIGAATAGAILGHARLGADLAASQPASHPVSVAHTAPSNLPGTGGLVDAASANRAGWEAYQDLTDGCRLDFVRSFQGLDWTEGGRAIGLDGAAWGIRLAPYVQGTCS